MAKSEDLSRRTFLGQTVGASAVGLAAPYVVSSSAFGANDKINVGVIGVNGQGNWNLGELLKQPDVVVTGICEVWKERRDKAIARCKGTAKPYTDFRELLAQKEIDAVLIATPPHWHALMCIVACEAGKDFYCEKPMTIHPAESIAVNNAVKKHKRITQIGTQIHAQPNYRRVVELIQSGNLGPISVVRTFNIMNQTEDGVGNAPDSDPPASLDWEMWVGPGPARKFNPTLATGSYHHCSFLDYSGGWTPGMAPHIIDLPYWALKLDIPTHISASGGRYVIKDCGDAYDVHEVVWQYPNFTMTWMSTLTNSYGWDFQGKGGMARRLGIYFHGVDGTCAANYGTHKIIPEGDRMKGKKTPPKTIPDSVGHHREWLDGIRARKQPLCHVGYNHKLNMAIALSVLSLKLGRSIRFDPKTEKIVGDAEAAKMAIPTYRDPWKFPEKYL